MAVSILLPPSEGKATGGDGPGWHEADGCFGARLAEARALVVDALTAVGGGDARLLGARGPTLDRARAANLALRGAPTLPAWQRFTGVVWDHLDVGSLPPAARQRARRSVLIVSALAGVSGLDDPLPDFRLKLSVRLGPLGPLTAFWRPTVTDVLRRTLRGRTVIDLLPQEHRAAWLPEPLRADIRRVGFVGDDGRVAGHAAKAAKGRLARDLLLGNDPDDVLAGWSHDGLRLQIDPPAGG